MSTTAKPKQVRGTKTLFLSKIACAKMMTFSKHTLFCALRSRHDRSSESKNAFAKMMTFFKI
jgi:hypothetical protein